MSKPTWWPRFMQKVVVTDDGCWHWTGYVMPNGYAQFWREGSKEYIHRLSYQVEHGRIPDGQVIDHLCRNRSCCNPAHLEAVSHQVNVQRGAKGSLVTACAQGHDYTPASTYIRPDGTRSCRRCRRDARNRSYARKVGKLAA